MDVFQTAKRQIGPFARSGKPLLRIAALALTALLVPASAEAALYLTDPEPALARPARPIAPRRQKQRRSSEKLMPVKESVKPQGPLVIAISIDRQMVKVYDANGLFAESPVSTGMRGHPTPMGVFSVIQKDKFHRSNIYSNAPMPFMQRVTWSGVAMHAGVLPGYPASHGCIRMPMAFAVKMWGWTRMGARVVITPGEIAPADFTHPLLALQKPAPAPVPMASGPDPITTAQPALKSDKNAAGNVRSAPEAPTLESANLDQKTGLDTPDGKTVADEAKADKRDQTQTADASGAIQTATSPTLSDVARTSTEVVDSKPTEQAEANEAAPQAAQMPAAVEAKPEPKQIAAAPDAKKDQGRPSDLDKPVAAKSDVKPDVAAAPAAPRRTGQIAAFISRKDGKLYVRQNFAPLFEVPVTIAASDRPLGTHVFTARADKDDAKVFHWSVVTLPASRSAERSDESERAMRHRKIASPIEMKPAPAPDTAAEALDRVTIPDDAKTRIAEALVTGGSIIVSDQGINSGETGEGTDFIMSLR